MEWWQAFLDFIAAFELWQRVLFYLAVSLVAIITGLYAGYWIIRLIYKERLPFKSVVFQLFKKRVITVSPRNNPAQSDKIPVDTQVVMKPIELPIPGLLDELESNGKIASKYSGGDLLPLQTDVWDAHQYSAYDLPDNLRDELEQVYSYMRLLNNLVWLATEGYHSSSLDGQYKKLLAHISERLNKIERMIEFGLVE